MKYLSSIDSAARCKKTIKGGVFVVAKPLEQEGIQKYCVRIRKAFYVLLGKADAFYYLDQ